MRHRNFESVADTLQVYVDPLDPMPFLPASLVEQNAPAEIVGKVWLGDGLGVGSGVGVTAGEADGELLGRGAGVDDAEVALGAGVAIGVPVTSGFALGNGAGFMNRTCKLVKGLT